MSNAATAPEQQKNLNAVYLTAEDIKLASSLLYQSYHDDPFFSQCFKASEAGYEQRLRAAIREELSVFWSAHQPMIGIFDQEDHLIAVACVIEPDADFGAGRYWHWRLKMMLTAGMVSTNNMIEKEKAVRAAISYQQYHLMSFIAVHPLHQKSGVGHFLLSAVDSLIREHETTEGVGVLVTVDKYQPFFEDCKYNQLTDVTVGKLNAKLMFKTKSKAS